MNTPITINFFKKIQLFQDLKAQNKVFKDSITRQDQLHYTKNTWEVEKKILFWSHWGHKHLGSPLVKDRYKNEKDLKQAKITAKEAKSAGISETMRNLVRRGFAEYENPEKKENVGILTTQRAALMGSLLHEVYKPKLITDQKQWTIYKDRYEAEYFLSRKAKYWLYNLIIISGWIVFIMAAILVTWALIEKVVGLIANGTN